MKKILTISVFAFALLISSQGFAQEKSSIKQDVMKISEALSLNEQQTDALATAYIKREKAYKSEKGKKSDEFKKRVQHQFLTSLKGKLTDAQITKLKALSEEK